MLGVFTSDKDYIYLADAYFGLGKYNDSIYYYKKTNTNNSNINTIYKIMLSNIKLKEYEKALEFGIKLSKFPINYLNKQKIKNLLFVFSKSKNYPHSANLCEKYMEFLGDACTIDDLRNASYINYIYGNVNNSIKYYEYITIRSDASIYDYLNAGYIFFNEKNYEKEKEYFYNALEKAKKDIKLNNLIIQYIIKLYKISVPEELLDLVRKLSVASVGCGAQINF
jgi:tetratricopeptide (TPR) repeat protein